MSANLIPAGRIETRILHLRGRKVMLDRDLADLYEIPAKALKQAVRRNPDRFPGDFMFVLTPEEDAIVRSQSVTSNTERWGGTRYASTAFTEEGVAMLSSVLGSPRAIQVNIAIREPGVRYLVRRRKQEKKL